MSGFLETISWLLKIQNQNNKQVSKEEDIIQKIDQMKLEETENTENTIKEKDRNSRGSWDWFVSTSPIETKYHINQLYEE